jgi:hypothetical protein
MAPPSHPHDAYTGHLVEVGVLGVHRDVESARRRGNQRIEDLGAPRLAARLGDDLGELPCHGVMHRDGIQSLDLGQGAHTLSACRRGGGDQHPDAKCRGCRSELVDRGAGGSFHVGGEARIKRGFANDTLNLIGSEVILPWGHWNQVRHRAAAHGDPNVASGFDLAEDRADVVAQLPLRDQFGLRCS